MLLLLLWCSLCLGKFSELTLTIEPDDYEILAEIDPDRHEAFLSYRFTSRHLFGLCVSSSRNFSWSRFRCDPRFGRDALEIDKHLRPTSIYQRVYIIAYNPSSIQSIALTGYINFTPVDEWIIMYEIIGWCLSFSIVCMGGYIGYRLGLRNVERGR